MNAVLMAIQQQKQNEKQKDKECYAQTSRIEEEANELTDYLREILHCDIVTIELLHNTEKYIGGYHKRFYDESFPSINSAEGISFNYKDFQCIPTNIFPIISYILKERFKWFSNIDEVTAIDSSYGRILKEQGSVALGMRAMKTSKGEDLGILNVTWMKGHENRIPDVSVIQEKMIEIASKLSEGFQHVRVDLYNINGKIYFGEYTFFHNSGLVPITPSEFDIKMGDNIIL